MYRISLYHECVVGGIFQTVRFALQDCQAALAEEQGDSKHLRDSLKLAQSEASVAKANLEAAQSELEANKRTIERLRSEVQVLLTCVIMCVTCDD